MSNNMHGFYTIYPKYPQAGYDLKATTADQVYRPEIPTAQIAKDAYYSVRGEAIKNEDDNMFCTEYRAGDYNANGHGESIAYQNGTAFLMNEFYPPYGTRGALFFYYDYADNCGEPTSGSCRIYFFDQYDC